MNTSTTNQQVYIGYKVGYQPGATAQNTRGVTPFFLDVDGCGDSEYDVPGNGGPGSVHTNTRTWTAPWGGYITGAGGHLHGGGIDISTCPVHKRFEAGQQFSVTARYDNSEPHPDVMGIVLAYAWRGNH